jgi:hypothetical protein
MMTLRLWIVLACALAICGSIAGAYVKGRGDGRSAILASQASEDRVRMETLQLAQQAAAEEISKIEIRNVTIRGRVEREVRVEPRYVDCKQTTEVFQLIQDAISGRLSAVDATQSSHGLDAVSPIPSE